MKPCLKNIFVATGTPVIADEGYADLTAVAIRYKSRFIRFISGSCVINEVIDHTFWPILTYHKQKLINLQ